MLHRLTGRRLMRQLDDLTLDLLLDELADRIAARIGTQPAPETVAEPWRLIALSEVAERLGRSERWVRERVRAGDLARVRLDGGAFAFELGDVIAFAEARRVGARELV